MKINVRKISVMAIIIILGLMAPKWLELKNTTKTISNTVSLDSKSIDDTFHLTDSYKKLHRYKYDMHSTNEGVLSFINHRVLGRMSSLRGFGSGSGLGVLLGLPFWLAVVSIIYFLFFALNFIVYSSFKKIGNPILIKNIRKKSPSRQDIILLYLLYFFLSFGITLWLWFLPLIVIMVVIFIFLKINSFTCGAFRK